MSSRPLISLCIPTYNRNDILRYVLQCFIANKEFDDEVELVISDNCSTDETQQTGEEFARKYTNIKYYRNIQNIHDQNFVSVLDRGEGLYLKLLNDWSYLAEEGLRFMKQSLKENLNEHNLLFFTNNYIFTDRKQLINYCTSIDDYMQVVSTYSTSNNIFGVWRDDWPKIVDKQRYSELKLQQVDWTYQLLKMYDGKCVMYDYKIMGTAPLKRKNSGYNWFKVHLDNYYTILEPYIKEGLISPETLLQDKHYLLQHFTPELRRTFHLTRRHGWNFDTDGTWKILMKYYKNDPYFYYFMLTLPLQKYIQRRKHRW